jgi:hypothetical protein
LRDEFSTLQEEIKSTLDQARSELDLQESLATQRCQLELDTTEFEKRVHLALIDVLYESQGVVIFNEVVPENSNPEFRFFNEEVVELNTSPEVLVMHG